MRTLGIDMGSKRIGIAISDESGTFALPQEVIPVTDEAISRIEEIAKQFNVTTIVMGESKDYKGVPNKIMVKTDEMADMLTKRGYHIIMEPEFMTSAHAERFQGKNELIDASAAALILQSYLEKNKR